MLNQPDHPHVYHNIIISNKLLLEIRVIVGLLTQTNRNIHEPIIDQKDYGKYAPEYSQLLPIHRLYARSSKVYHNVRAPSQ